MDNKTLMFSHKTALNWEILPQKFQTKPYETNLSWLRWLQPPSEKTSADHDPKQQGFWMFSGKNIIEITKQLASEDPHPHLHIHCAPRRL